MLKVPKHQNYRVCYDNGNPDTGNKIYELYKYCTCSDCSHRSWKREPPNRAVANTKDILKVDEVAEFLKKWTCENGKRLLEPVYYKF